jgi:hypothetical protein
MNTLILYKGISLLDNITPVVVFITGLNYSTNKKTGDMLQTHILIDDEIKPSDHVKNGTDGPICGSCKYKSGNGCYVQTYYAQNAIHRAYLAGKYQLYRTKQHNHLLEGRAVRIGSYGDPAAIPSFVWINVMLLCKQWTSYTHQWQDDESTGRVAPDLSNWSMASTDTYEEALAAINKNYRIFHVAKDLSDIEKIPNSIWCPATPEGGMKSTCIKCQLCSGQSKSAKNILVMPHGTNWVIDRALKAKSNSKLKSLI